MFSNENDLLMSENLVFASVSNKIQKLAELAIALDAKSLSNIDERVWAIAKQQKEIPSFSAIYAVELFKILENLIKEKYSHLNLDIKHSIDVDEYFTDGKFLINDTEICNKHHFANCVVDASVDLDVEYDIRFLI